MGFLPNIGPLELIIVLVIAVLILGRSAFRPPPSPVGRGIRNQDSLGGGSGDEKKYEKSSPARREDRDQGLSKGGADPVVPLNLPNVLTLLPHPRGAGGHGRPAGRDPERRHARRGRLPLWPP